MAQKRLLDKKISISEQISNLPLEAQLIFTWSIPHTDDLGLLPISLKTLKAMIIPMMEMSIETFQFQVEQIQKQNLWESFEHNGDRYYRLIKFTEHQTLKKDRQPQTYLKDIIGKTPDESWKNVEKLGFEITKDDVGNQMEDNGNQMESEEKRREEKRSKDNIREEKKIVCLKKEFSEFNNVKLSDDELIKLKERFGDKNTGILIEELGGYIASTNKRYSSHYATLLNWGRRKVQEHTPKPKQRSII